MGGPNALLRAPGLDGCGSMFMPLVAPLEWHGSFLVGHYVQAGTIGPWTVLVIIGSGTHEFRLFPPLPEVWFTLLLASWIMLSVRSCLGGLKPAGDEALFLHRDLSPLFHFLRPSPLASRAATYCRRWAQFRSPKLESSP